MEFCNFGLLKAFEEKFYRALEFDQWLKRYIVFNTQKRIRIETEKNGDKDGKALYKLLNNASYEKHWKT